MDNCVFCKIIKKEIPSITVYDDERFLGIMDISPANKGHVILLAKNHVADVFDLDEQTASRAMIVVSKVAKALKEELNCEGINVLQNNGTVAGQTVFHYHIHIIPRHKDDGVNIAWEYQSYGEGEGKDLGEAIKRCIK